MTNSSQTGKSSLIVSMPRGDFIGIFLLGGLVGLVSWVLGMLLHQYAFEAYLCQEEALGRCGSSEDYAAVTAMLLAAGVALVGLIRLRVYRPLFVLIASMLGLWGLLQISWGVPLFQGLAASLVLYALAFATFSWIARIRPFLVSLAMVVILVVVLRLIITA